jgi:hypothetical protein
MPMDIEQAKGTSGVSEVQFSNVLYYFIKMYGDSVYYGLDKMQKALDNVEGMLAHYRYTVHEVFHDPKTKKWYSYDQLKEKNLEEYEKALKDLSAVDYEKKKSELDYAFLREKFKCLMLLVGKSQLLPSRDVIQEQD